MRNGVLVACVILAIAAGWAVPAAAGVDPRPAPEFTLIGVDGDPVSLEDFRGGPVVLRFFTTWCAACAEDLAALQAFWADGGNRVLAVSLLEDAGAVQSHMERLGYGFPVAVDPTGRVGALYGVRYIPTTVIVSGEGEIVHVQVGPMGLTELRGWMTAGARGGGPDPVGVAVAFIAGLLSFFSPCVWPLYPVYVGMLAGGRGRALAGSASFVLGFSVVFMALGLAASAVGQALLAHGALLQKVAGAVILILGLHQSGLMPLPLLLRERRLQLSGGRGLVGTFATGAGFGLGWSPCVGPVLAAILVYAGTAAAPWSGPVLLGAYSLGFGLPLLALSAGFGRLNDRLGGGGRWLPAVSRAGGLFLIALGIAIYLGLLGRLTGWLYGLV